MGRPAERHEKRVGKERRRGSWRRRDGVLDDSNGSMVVATANHSSRGLERAAMAGVLECGGGGGEEWPTY